MNAKYKYKIQVTNVIVIYFKYTRLFSHDSIAFESSWAPDINVGSLCLGGDRSKQVCFECSPVRVCDIVQI